jgi:3-hydroxy-3-methylglutaryl CoA synthase/uncharacterized OB-fold protein
VHGILSYGSYLPRPRLSREEVGRLLGSRAGKGERVSASFDEDATTLAVEACRAALGGDPDPRAGVANLWLATTSPPYLDKTNAAIAHAALSLPADSFAADVNGAARSGIAALLAAASQGGLAALADVRTGRPQSADESGGGDGAAAFLFGAGEPIAELLATAAASSEFLDRWRDPSEAVSDVWEERFGAETLKPLVRETAARVLAKAGVEQADHVVLVSSSAGLRRVATTLVTGAVSTGTTPIGHAGAADAGLALAATLDVAAPGQTILLISASDGCDALLLRTTDALPVRRQPTPVAAQIAGSPVPYARYLTWRGLLDREPPRRPEPEAPAAPPSARTAAWKFSFSGSRCRACDFVHLPPARSCKRCGTVDQMDEARMSSSEGRIATFTVDHLAYSLSPPVAQAVVDFDGGGRYTLEVADADEADLAVGRRVSLTFRRLFTAGGVHNYFWKARVLPADGAEQS